VPSNEKICIGVERRPTMLTAKKDITMKAMILNYHYHCVFHHDLDAIRSHKQFGEWWDEMDNTNRAYVLKGKFRRQ